VRIAERGSLLGLPATASGRPYSLTAEVVLDSEFSLVTPSRFRQLLVESPSIGLDVLRMLGDEVSTIRQLFVYKR
jgi:CRP-like cAMP-binding protein